MAVHPWWCPAQGLTLHTTRLTARAKKEISSLLERKGLKQLIHHQSHQVGCYFLVSRFCQKKGPNNFRSSGNKLTVSFTSDRTVEGEGAECTIACSDLIPAGQSRGSPHVKKKRFLTNRLPHLPSFCELVYRKHMSPFYPFHPSF